MSKQLKMATMDGNQAASHVAYMFTEVSGIFPITPSSPMAEWVEAWAAEGRRNLFGSVPRVVEMQSEAGAAGAVHGALQAGTLATTYTASQGLLLMIPDIYKLKGQLLPGVIHVAARSLATKALSIFGDHQDIYACRQIGAPMIASHSVQEAMDLAGVAHALAINSSVPVINFFDGFRTSHELQKIEVLEQDKIGTLLNRDALDAFRKRSLAPSAPTNRGGAENDDIYFQGVEAQNTHFDKAIDEAARLFEKVSDMTGRNYAPFTFYGHENAEEVIIAMGSVTETVKETIDTLNAAGRNVGLVKVHLYRPFSVKHLTNVIPKSVKKIAVLDRTKETGAREPLYLDVVAALKDTNITVVGGRFGLSSKNTAPRHIKAVFDNLSAKNSKDGFTIGINDDVTKLSLPFDADFIVNKDYTSCLFYGLGSDGTVGANKNTIKIIGDNTNNFAQGYFQYDSKKSGGTTRSHLRFGPSPLQSTYYVEAADFIAVSVESYLHKFDVVKPLAQGGTLLINTTMPSDKVVDYLPNKLKKDLADKNGKLYIINASSIAREIGMGNRTNTILQSAFFHLNPQILPTEKSNQLMKDFAKKSYSKKGDAIVELNYKAIDAAPAALVEVAVDTAWSKLTGEAWKSETGDIYFDEFVGEIAALRGDQMPVSAFMDKVGGVSVLDGSFRNNVTYKEKRQISSVVPKWLPENCIGCNKCAMVCPHATIRAFALEDAEAKNAPGKELATLDLPAFKGYKFRIQVDPLNCVGCALCVKECPGKGGNKALVMSDTNEEVKLEAENTDYLYKNSDFYRGEEFGTDTPLGAAMLYPYFEGSGACAGCGETPYYRLVTQFFGEDMVIANATGCSSIYSGSTPSSPFATNNGGNGPAWANSLFEDNAEFGAGMQFGHTFKYNRIAEIMKENLDSVEPGLKSLFDKHLGANGDRDVQREVKAELIDLIKASSNQNVSQILDFEDALIRKSQWIIGGDGWAYDIGYGGLDHVMASGENVNILVLDTEVYSNTGGQSSKSSQAGSIAKFTAAGKELSKKNLPAIAMTYGDVYVASISMGANSAQTVKAIKEAEAYDGVSIIIAYSPCISHGLKGGLMNHQAVQKASVECGYYNLFRFDPRLEEQGKNPMQIDFANPDFNKYRDFLINETRYANLMKINPANAERLYEKARKDAERRFNFFKTLSNASAGGSADAGADAGGSLESQIEGMLPGLNCGACGSKTCEGLSKDIVAKSKDENSCVPANDEQKANIKAFREENSL